MSDTHVITKRMIRPTAGMRFIGHEGDTQVLFRLSKNEFGFFQEGSFNVKTFCGQPFLLSDKEWDLDKLENAYGVKLIDAEIISWKLTG